MDRSDPLIVRAELPTPDVVVIRHASGKVTVFADTSLPDETIDDLLDFDPDAGTGHALG